MTDNRWDELLAQDWSASWDELPEAPPLVPRTKDAQVTLRLPSSLLLGIRRVADKRGLPYHAVARSWIVDGLRRSNAVASVLSDEPQQEQLNLKIDQESLDTLKQRAHELGRPYHRFARECLQDGLRREEAQLGLAGERKSAPPIKDLMVLLLHSENRRGEHTVRGITQLQKLMFVLERKVTAARDFYAYDYGPFNEQVNDALEALRLAGFLRGREALTTERPSFRYMMSTVSQRSGPRGKTAERYELSELGHSAAEALLRSSAAYQKLYEKVRAARLEWDSADLLGAVYEAWPEYTEKSLIREKVTRRRPRRDLADK